MNVELLPLGMGHGALLSELHNLAFKESWRAEEFENLMAQPARFGFLATKNALPIGFVLCQGDEVECEIITLATHPDKRRTQVATTLMREVLSSTQKVILDVAEDNKAALSLYQKLNFVEIGRRKNYYKRPGLRSVDALVMASSP